MSMVASLLVEKKREVLALVDVNPLIDGNYVRFALQQQKSIGSVALRPRERPRKDNNDGGIPIDPINFLLDTTF
jgi:hypothetical protein